MATKLQPDNEAAVDFLKRWEKKGPWVLTAIHPNRKEIDTKTFTSKTAKDLKSWLEKFNGERNIYFHVNPTLRELTTKANREDIKEVRWLHVDVDPRAGEDLKEEQERCRRLLTSKLPQGVPPPTVVIFSGGGYQGFWKLNEPIPVEGDIAKAEEAARYNQQLELLFGADKCHNIDRIMRLPGTINLPNATKKKKGRKKVLAYLVDWEKENHYDLNKFIPAPPVQMAGGTGFDAPNVDIGGNIDRYSMEDLDKWEVSDRLKVVIAQGSHPEERKEKDNSRSAWLFDAVCNLVRQGVPDEVIFSIVTDPDYGISESVLDKKDPSKFAIRQIGRGKEQAVNPYLRRLNDEFAVIENMGGKCRVIEESYDHALKRNRITQQSFDDFRNRHMHIQVQSGTTADGKPTLMPLGHWWLKQPKRRQFKTMVFSPGEEVEGAYNLWTGFACRSIPGDCSVFLEHTLKNVCNGNEDIYHYLMSWMARSVQQPNTPGYSAVVLRGMRGVGKSAFAKHYGAIFGRHFLHIANSSHLVGNFNAHLQDTVVLFADEAFFAGDKKHVSILKALITEETIQIEKKHMDSEPAPNYVHLLMASNDEHVIPAGGDERRFLVLDVGRKNQKDSKFFKAMADQMSDGGREALLHHLMTFDIEKFEVRNVPDTKALQDQKMYSLMPEESWWYEKLKDGQLLEIKDGWFTEVSKEALTTDFITYAERFKISRRGSATALGKFLSRVCPGIKSYQRHGEWQNGSGVTRKGRRRFYSMLTLTKARSVWEDLYGKFEDWPDVEYEQSELDWSEE